MLRLVARRLLVSIPLIVIVSFFVFLLIDLAPGDAAESLAGDDVSAENIQAIRERLHLDDNVIVRYVRWLGDVVQGDLGRSFQTTEQVRSMIADRFFVTFSLVMVTLVMTSIVGVVLGVLASLRPGGVVDRVVTALSAIAVAVPPFWLALVLVVSFAINRSWLPAISYTPLSEGWWEWLRHLILPSIALGALPGAELTMQLKGSLTETLGRDFILTTRAKGLRSRSIVVKHGLKNAAVPVVTVLGFRFAQMLGGTVILESLFDMDGLGSLALRSTLARDVPVLLGLVVVTTAIVAIVNALVDASYAYFNPRAEPRVTAVVDPPAGAGGEPPAPTESLGGGGRTRVLRRFLSNKLAVVALLFIVAVVVIAILAPVFAPNDPNEQALTEKFQAGNGVLGTDEFGRDQLSRLIYGARASLVAAAISVGLAVAVGVPAGIVAGYRGRLLDASLSRTSDALQSVPALILALAVIAVLGPGLVNAMLAVGIVTIPRFFRVARAAAVEVSGETFIEASRALGCSQARIMLRHIFPNTLAPLVVQLSLAYGAGITAEASLSFLGLGVRAPTSSWGSMLASASKNYNRAEYMIYAPGVAIALTVLAFMLVGDGLRHAFGTRRTAGSEER